MRTTNATKYDDIASVVLSLLASGGVAQKAELRKKACPRKTAGNWHAYIKSLENKGLVSLHNFQPRLVAVGLSADGSELASLLKRARPADVPEKTQAWMAKRRD